MSKGRGCLGPQHLHLILFLREYRQGWLPDSALEVGSLVQEEACSDDVA